MPSNYIGAFAMDELGFLWIGTSNGLCRFDGPDAFKVYQTNNEEKQNTNSLRVNIIKDLYSDSEGYLWIGTSGGGLTRHSPTKGTWKTFMIEPGDKGSDKNFIICIFEDSKKRMWLGTEDGLYRFNKTTETFYHFKPENTNNYPTISGGITSILEDDNGWLWLTNWLGGVYLLLEDENGNYDPKNISQFYDTGSKAAKNAWLIYQDKAGKFWVGTHRAGLLLMSLPENASNQVGLQNWKPNFKTIKFGFAENSNVIQDIHQDKFDDLWVATNNGLFKIHYKYLSAENISIKTLLTKYDTFIPSNNDNSITSEDFTKIFEDKQGLLWLGTSNGLNQFNPYINQFKNAYLNDEHQRFPNSKCIAVDANQNIWINTFSEGLNKYRIEDTHLKKNDNLNHLILGKVTQSILLKEDRWMYTATEEGLTIIDLETKKSNQFPFSNQVKSEIENLFTQVIYVDRLNFIWLCTTKGLFRLNSKTKAYEVFLPNPENINSISHNNINSVIEDDSGSLWVATYKGLNRVKDITADTLVFERFLGHIDNPDGSLNTNTTYALKPVNNIVYIGTNLGLNGYDLSTNKFENLSSSIAPFSVRSIEKGMNNDLWISSNEGIFNYNIKTKSYRLFDKGDFFDNPSYRRRASCIDKNNNVYFANTSGITYFSMNNIFENKISPPVYITTIEIENSKKVKNRITNGIYQNEVELNYNDFRLSIEYAALNYYRADKNKYKYRLKGLQDGWKTIEFGAPIVFTSLEPNEYRLEVKATNNEGIWSKETATINIIKHPSNKDLEQFAHVTSHDLKEPLKTISGFVSLIAKGYADKLDAKGTKFLNIIESSTQRMSKLIESILTYSTVGNKDIVYSKFNLNELVKAKLLDLSLKIEKKNAIVKIGELPDIIGHEQQIGMVFYNLINNALKFNNQPQPVVSVKHEPSEEGYWKFSVKDNGIGIEPKYQEKIFDMFKRLHSKHEYEGTGIGLSVCQKIVLRHNGKIWFNSKPDEGTTFFITIKKGLE